MLNEHEIRHNNEINRAIPEGFHVKTFSDVCGGNVGCTHMGSNSLIFIIAFPFQKSHLFSKEFNPLEANYSQHFVLKGHVFCRSKQDVTQCFLFVKLAETLKYRHKISNAVK